MSGVTRTGTHPELLEEGLAPGACELLGFAGELAASRVEELYLVGGAVRDRFRGEHPEDLDVKLDEGIRFIREKQQP